MIPVDQTKFGVPDGNCATAAIASILEFGPSDPDFTRLEKAHNEIAKGPANIWTEWWRTVTEVAIPRGFAWVTIGAMDAGGFAPVGFAIANGLGPRGHGHAVVVNSGAVVHDPHPSRAGLINVAYYTVFVPLVPTSLVSTEEMP